MWHNFVWEISFRILACSFFFLVTSFFLDIILLMIENHLRVLQFSYESQLGEVEHLWVWAAFVWFWVLLGEGSWVYCATLHNPSKFHVPSLSNLMLWSCSQTLLANLCSMGCVIKMHKLFAYVSVHEFSDRGFPNGWGVGLFLCVWACVSLGGGFFGVWFSTFCKWIMLETQTFLHK